MGETTFGAGGGGGSAALMAWGAAMYAAWEARATFHVTVVATFADGLAKEVSGTRTGALTLVGPTLAEAIAFLKSSSSSTRAGFHEIESSGGDYLMVNLGDLPWATDVLPTAGWTYDADTRPGATSPVWNMLDRADIAPFYRASLNGASLLDMRRAPPGETLAGVALHESLHLLAIVRTGYSQNHFTHSAFAYETVRRRSAGLSCRPRMRPPC